MKTSDNQSDFAIPKVPDEYFQEFDLLLKKLESVNERAQLKLRKIYNFLDHFAEHVSTFTVCGKGCAYCCAMDIGITDLEARVIEEATGIVRRSGQRRASGGHTDPCPFLAADGACSIYMVRPFNCRTLYTLDDAKYCASGEPHLIYGSSDGQYSVYFYAKLNEVLVKLNGNKPVLDIRDYFPGK